MAQTSAYKPGGGDIRLWVTFCVFGVLGYYLFVFGLIGAREGQPLEWWLWVLALSPVVAAAVAGVILLARRKPNRIESIRQASTQLGVDMTTKMTPEQRAHFAKYLGHLLPHHGMLNKEAGLLWIAEQADGTPWRFVVAEHQFISGKGKFRDVHHHTLIAWPAGHVRLKGAQELANAPWFFMGKFGRRGRHLPKDRLKTSEEFGDLDSAWMCRGDAATGRRFLSPAAKRLLDASPKNETWSLGAGWVCCTCRGTLDAANLDRFIAHAHAVLSVV